MQHGTQAYFVERTRFARRTSALTAVVAVAFLGLLAFARTPWVRERFPLDAQRFGFEGPDQYVRRIVLETEPLSPRLPSNGVIYVPRQSQRGGTVERGRSEHPRARPEPRPIRIGPGMSEADLLSRARRLYRRAPVVQSEDLVIDVLVRPTYPEEARELGIEGRVALVALVDTTGSVVDVDLMTSSGARQLEHAASVAVWQCRFRPYRVDGRTREVYAVFRFNFHLD